MTSLFRFPGSAFNVTVHELGLPVGATWSFNVSGEPAADTNGSTLGLFLPNASYEFVATTSLNGWDSPNGSFVVNGTATNVSVTFLAATFPVTFVRVGLPNGTWWELDVSGIAEPGTNATSIVVPLADGPQTYSASTNGTAWASPSGNFTVANSSIRVNVTFAPQSFAATVTESGLSAGVGWWVNVTGFAPDSSIATTIQLDLPVGSYQYLASADGNVWSRVAGTLDLDTGPTSASVHFALETYSVTFASANLSSGASWNLTFGGSTDRVVSGEIAEFVESNGTYPYGVTGPTNAPPLVPAGSLVVKGEPLPVTIRFDPALEVTAFVSSPASVTLGGSAQLEVTALGGTGPRTFTYSGLPNGCVGSNASTLTCTPNSSGQYTVTVAVTDSVGARTSAVASLGVSSAVVPPPKSTPPPDWALFAGVGVVVVVAAIAAVLLWRRSRTRDP
jgi:hypothetical protein